MLKILFRNAMSNLRDVFAGKNILWHAAAALLTAFFVFSGADWYFFEATRSPFFLPLIWTAGIGGFFAPAIIPITLYLWGEFRRRHDFKLLGAAAGQAAVLAYLISITYKAFTGRVEPEFLTTLNALDNSRDFNFGFLEHGVFWGWPSSHTAVAFAGAVAIVCLTRNMAIRTLMLMYAVFVGTGAAIGFHWLSDALAGAVIGTLVGAVVAKSFRT